MKVNRASKIWILLLFLGWLGLQAGEFRKFTSVEGSVILAELIQASDQAVSLRRHDGVIFQNVALERFSQYDRHYIEIWVKESKVPRGQSIYRLELGGRLPGVCAHCHSASRVWINGAGTVFYLPGQFQGQCSRNACFNGPRRHGLNDAISELRGTRIRVAN